MTLYYTLYYMQLYASTCAVTFDNLHPVILLLYYSGEFIQYLNALCIVRTSGVSRQLFICTNSPDDRCRTIIGFWLYLSPHHSTTPTFSILNAEKQTSCNIENVGVAWGRGQYYMLYYAYPTNYSRSKLHMWYTTSLLQPLTIYMAPLVTIIEMHVYRLLANQVCILMCITNNWFVIDYLFIQSESIDIPFLKMDDSHYQTLLY